MPYSPPLKIANIPPETTRKAITLSIHNADIHFNQQGTPVASQFDDVYFSNSNGMLETNYVFLHNNGLPQRWTQWQKSHFVIAETGFGTGLNFLVTLQAYCQQDREKLPQLHFISIEKYPLSADDLQAALASWPQLREYAEQLIAQYPPAIPGCHRLSFADGAVTLDLWLGDVEQVLPQIHSSSAGLVDAWYLDGFAPSKNPQMWQPALFEQMARLANTDCTFATFTAAGIVKRGLAAAGFTPEKRPGFGKKRDMLAGSLTTPWSTANRAQAGYFQRLYGSEKNKQIAVIGAGIAGASIARALVAKGYHVDVYFHGQEVAGGASGNWQGGFYPQLNAEFSIHSQIQALSFVYASQLYRQLLQQGFEFAHQWCDVLQLAFNDKVSQRYHNLASNGVWPQELVELVDPATASGIAGLDLPYSALHIHKAGWINPPQLVQALFNAAAQHGSCQLFADYHLQDLQHQDGRWRLNWQQQPDTEADLVILATGSESDALGPMQGYPLRMVRGQVEQVPSQEPIDKLRTVLCHKGYLTPAYQGYHALGSTYVKNDRQCDYREQEEWQNLQTQQQALSQCLWPQKLKTERKGRAAVRCSSPDHLPLVGAVADITVQAEQYADLYKALLLEHYPQAENIKGLYMLTGLGSRGLTTAPLMAEILASQIHGSPLPLSNNLLNALNPNRFLIRQLIRRQTIGS